MSSFSTTDLCDAHPEIGVLAPLFRDFGGLVSFGGPIETVRVVDDNVLIREALEEPGSGRVLVIDGALDFTLTGVLASVTSPLAAAHISLFAFSTFDTDYVMVKSDKLDDAVAALRAAGPAVHKTR